MLRPKQTDLIIFTQLRHTELQPQKYTNKGLAIIIRVYVYKIPSPNKELDP